jgi:hypothetical protein
MIDDGLNPDGEDGARASDRDQAAYFRGVLDEERVAIEAGLVQSRLRLDDILEKGNLFEIRRLQNHVRDRESQLFHVVRMIERLDRRFSQRR